MVFLISIMVIMFVLAIVTKVIASDIEYDELSGRKHHRISYRSVSSFGDMLGLLGLVALFGLGVADQTKDEAFLRETEIFLGSLILLIILMLFIGWKLKGMKI